MEATLAHSKQFKLKFKMIWTFKIKFKCKVDGDLCELEVRVDDDLKEHKISELGDVELDSAMNSEVVKADASLAPLAMMRKAEPRAYDLFIVKPEKEVSRGDDMEVKGVNENSLEVTLTQYKQFKFKFKMIWTFKFCFKCKLKYKFLLKFSIKNCTTDVSSCFLCDICGRWFRTTKDLEKYKKIKCDLRSQRQLADLPVGDLEISYARPNRAGGEELLAPVIFSLSKNHRNYGLDLNFNSSQKFYDSQEGGLGRNLGLARLVRRIWRSALTDA